MMLNPMNPFVSAKAERDFIEGLIIEDIQVSGVETIYFKKGSQPPSFFNESTVNEYVGKTIIECGVKRIDNFDGNADLFSKFGIVPMDSATLVYSVKRFRKEAGEPQPHEGDVIYMPACKTFWEVRHVKSDDVMATSGESFTFVLECVVYQPGAEEQLDGSEYQNDDLSFLQTPESEQLSTPKDLSSGLTVTQEPVFDALNPFGG